MGDGHGGPEQVAARSDRLADGLSAMEDHLQVEVRDGGTRDADVVVRGDRPCPGVDERPVRPVDRLEDTIALAIETGRRGCREDRIAFELDQREIRLDAFDDGVLLQLVGDIIALNGLIRTHDAYADRSVAAIARDKAERVRDQVAAVLQRLLRRQRTNAFAGTANLSLGGSLRAGARS